MHDCRAASGPVGHGTPAKVAGDLSSCRVKAGLDAFQINFHGNRNVDQLYDRETGWPLYRGASLADFSEQRRENPV